MKYVSYMLGHEMTFGILSPDETYVYDLKKEGCETLLDWIIQGRKIEDVEMDRLERKPLSGVKLLAPIPHPRRNIFCRGKNYYEHALESTSITTSETVPSYPIYFSKAQWEIPGPNATILLRDLPTEKLDYEVELALIIGRQGKNIKASEAFDYIFGITVANDLSARDLQVRHQQWLKGKSLDGLCPMGPCILGKESFNGKKHWSIKAWVNDELRQDSHTKKLIFDIPSIIEDISKGMTLLPGDIILTGTPAGVGIGFDPQVFLKPGDEITCEIEDIGKLTSFIG